VRLEQLVKSVAALEGRPNSGNDFELACRIGSGYAGRSARGTPILLLPMRISGPSAARRTGAMRLTPSEGVRFSFAGDEWTETAAAIECIDLALAQPFWALVCDLTSRLPDEKPAWDTVVDLFDEWQRLLARRGKLGAERELGLWGELRFMLDSPDPNKLLECWRGPSAANLDFQGAVAAEVKTSMHEHEHDISHDQVSALRATGGYLVSMWIEPDPNGDSLPDVLERLSAVVARPDRLLREALRIGYSTADSASYTARYSLREAPAWYAAREVPTVRELDLGVLDVRFRVRLPIDRRLSNDDCVKIWDAWCPTGER
jgi:hypothetical protein